MGWRGKAKGNLSPWMEVQSVPGVAEARGAFYHGGDQEKCIGANSHREKSNPFGHLIPQLPPFLFKIYQYQIHVLI